MRKSCFKQDLEKYKGNPQLKQLVEILKDLSNNKINFFLGPSSKNRKEYHMENRLLLIYRIDTDILGLSKCKELMREKYKFNAYCT